MNTVIIGNTIQDIASSVANSKWGRYLIPTIEELNQTITKDSKMSAKWMDEIVQERVADTLENLVPRDKIDELAQTVHSTTYNRDIDKLVKSIEQYTDKANVASEIMKEEVKEVVDKGLDNVELGFYDKITKYPQAYFKNPNKKVRNTRIGTAIGGYAAVSIGGRYLQGGTLTTDEYGRKDIAGIPFL